MVLRSSLVVAALAVLSACGGVEKKACSATKPCGLNEMCQLPAGTCVSLFAAGGGAGGSNGSGGGSASACNPACSGAAPRCLSAGGLNQCVQCLGVSDCSDGMGCNLATHACELSGSAGGGGEAGGAGGGSAGGASGTGGGASGTGGGASGTGGGASGTGGGWAGTGGGYAVYDAGSGPPFNGRGSCAPQDAGVVACNPGCTDGFSCVNGVCALNGATGRVQVTLRWNSQEDLDLHVDEPLPNGTTCEIYYSDPNSDPINDPSSCGAMGSLDLDSEAGCSADYVDIENVIYPAGAPVPRGQYTVRVDHYANCNPALTMVPFEVEARFNGMSVGLCGYFSSTDPDWDDSGSSGAGRQVMTFFVP